MFAHHDHTETKRLATFAMTALLLVPLAVHAADFRGFASPGPMGVILFQECQGKRPAAQVTRVEDATKDSAFSEGLIAVARIMLNPGRPIYVEFRGQGGGPAIKAQEFQRAVGTFVDCAAAEPIATGVNFWAAGDDPAWRLVANSNVATLERSGAKPVRFPAAPFSSKAGAAVAQAQRTIDAWSALDGGTVRVEITPGMCSDGRSETAYGASAVVRYGSRSYEGCAARF